MTPTALTAPDAPTGVSATGGLEQATVNWTAPGNNGGSAITGYRVTPYIGSTAQTPVSVPAPANSKTITGLTGGTAYTFKVAAINAVGTGPDSEASNSVTPTALTAPDAPTGVSATGGHEQATVNWTAPANNGGSAITSYRVTPFIGSTAQTPVSVPAPATSKTITGLTGGTAYTFKVAAINAIGTGPDSAASNSVTPTALTAPDAPTGVSATGGQEQATVNWTAPGNNGGSAITSYRVTPYIGTTAQTPVSVPAPANSKTITGLTGGTAYTFKVAAINAIGTGPDSEASNSVTPTAPTAPGAPTAVSATAGVQQATVNWTAPASDGGSPITSYRVTPYIGATAQTPVTVAAPATSKTITGLTGGTAYTFKVAAINAVGTGAGLGRLEPGDADGLEPAGSTDRAQRDREELGSAAELDRSGEQRRQPDLRLPDHPLHRRRRADSDEHRVDLDLGERRQPRQRHRLHLHGRRDQRRRRRAGVGRVGRDHPVRHDLRPRDPGYRRLPRRQRGRARGQVPQRRRRQHQRNPVLQIGREHRHPCRQPLERDRHPPRPGQLQRRVRVGVAAGEIHDPGRDHGQHDLRGRLPARRAGATRSTGRRSPTVSTTRPCTRSRTGPAPTASTSTERRPGSRPTASWPPTTGSTSSSPRPRPPRCRGRRRV